MQHLSVIEHYANMLRVDEAERAGRNDVEHRFGFAHAAADDLQNFGGCGLASVSFVKFSPKLLDLSAKLLLHTAGQNLGRHNDAQCLECSRKSRNQSMALMPMTLDEARVAPIYAMALARTMPGTLSPPPHMRKASTIPMLNHASLDRCRGCDHGADAL